MHARGRLAFCLALGLVACGSNGGSGVPDAGPDRPDAEGFQACGNFMTEGTETCDDGNTAADDGCDPDCQLECGDGVVTGTEACDSGIVDGEGACPTEETCNDADPCTSGVISGDACEAICEVSTITGPVDDDECCPKGQDSTTDNDCSAVCGNGIVEAPEETCDTDIAQGDPGACPLACDDGELCTTDSLDNGGTCAAECTETPITEIGVDDGCCPAGADPNTDDDCLDSCGDGVVSGDETCDIDIAAGNPGACPTSCDDGDVCTSDTLVNQGTCFDDCVEAPLPTGPDDGCCPAGADIGDDPDCPAACGDGEITAPETCDDGNDDPGDGCSGSCLIEPVGFRFTDLDLKDPHIFATIGICLDVTNIEVGDTRGVNPLLQFNIQNDDPDAPDGLLDLSMVNAFTPFAQNAGSTPQVDLTFPDCTSPMSNTSCTLPAGSEHTTAVATNMASGVTCLAPVAGTTSGYSPGVVSTIAPGGGGTCYVGNAGNVTFDLGGIPIQLEDARIAGEWLNTPATGVRDGLIRGFMSEATANATIIPEGTTGIDSIDGSALSALLRGGVGSCSQGSPSTGDTDVRDGVDGWYFYLNFSAERVPYIEE